MITNNDDLYRCERTPLVRQTNWVHQASLRFSLICPFFTLPRTAAYFLSKDKCPAQSVLMSDVQMPCYQIYVGLNKRTVNSFNGNHKRDYWYSDHMLHTPVKSIETLCKIKEMKKVNIDMCLCWGGCIQPTGWITPRKSFGLTLLRKLRWNYKFVKSITD